MESSQKNKFHIILPLLVIALACSFLLWIVYGLTQGKIQDNARAYKLRLIESVIFQPGDNELYEDFIEITDPVHFSTSQPVSVFRIRQNKQPIGVVFSPVIAKGYSGNIELTIGVTYDGTLMGMRVQKHKETEGLGDRIDHEKSDWINHFTNHSLENTPLEKWAVSADGGEFDELSGATITSRGVINAVRKTLEYYQANRDNLY